MSEHAGIRFKEKESVSILLGKKEVGESSYHHNSLWMAHWTSHTQNEQGPISPYENTKTSVSEQLVIGMNRHTTTSSNLSSKNENSDFYFNTLTQKSVVSSKTEACEVLEGFDHFPMYSFKKKILNILNPKGKARFENRILGINLTFHPSDEFHFETQVQDPIKHQLTALESCSCSEVGNVSTSSQVKCPSEINRTQSMDSADSLRRSRKRKAVSLFEMMNVPTEPYDMAQSRKSKFCENSKWHGMIGNFRNPEGQFEQTDDALLVDKSISIEDRASSRAQKVMIGLESPRVNFMATASEKSLTRDMHVGPLNTNQDLDPFQTVTIDAAENLPKSSSKRTADSNSMEKQQKPSGQEEQGNRWLKRLSHDISSNSFMLNPKRLKLQNNNPSWVSEQKMKSWIQRWRVQKAPSEEGGETIEVVQTELQERQFPSIHAMAMMGKAMNKIRPCEFERRGTSLVWNNN